VFLAALPGDGLRAGHAADAALGFASAATLFLSAEQGCR
jgi:hypothetical protein